MRRGARGVIVATFMLTACDKSASRGVGTTSASLNSAEAATRDRTCAVRAEVGTTSGIAGLTRIDARELRAALPTSQAPSAAPSTTTMRLYRGVGVPSPHEPVARYALDVGGKVWALGGAIDATTVVDGVVRLRTDRVLEHVEAISGCVRRLADGVVPGLAADPSGERLVFEKELIDRTSLFVLEMPPPSDRAPMRVPAPRELTPSLAHAGDAVFASATNDPRASGAASAHGDTALVFIGSVAGGLPGIYRVASVDAPIFDRLTNAGLVSGEGRPASFVPIPATRESIALRGDTLTYDDGDQRVALDLASRKLTVLGPSALDAPAVSGGGQ